MASPSSPQGSAPGFLRKRKQTPEDLIVYSLEDLRESDFNRFKNKLSDFSYENKHPIPRSRLENADWITTKKFLVDTYGEEGALDVTIEVLKLIDLMGPANDLQERRAQSEQEHNPQVKIYRGCVRPRTTEKRILRQNDVQSHQEEARVESAPSAESKEEPDNLVTPTLDGKTYRLELKPDDLFCCSETGIMFKVKSEVTITYELELESDNLDKIQKKGYDVVGPMCNITVEPGVVSEVHLPHSLCLRGKLKQLAKGRSCRETCPDSTAKDIEECAIDESAKVDSDTFLSSTGLKRGIALIRCGNFQDEKCNIIKPVSIEPSQFQKVALLSGLVVAYTVWKCFTPFKVKVLLYGKVVCPEDVNYMEYKFHLYVIPRKQPEIRELDKQKKADGFKRLRKPHQIQCSLRYKTQCTVGVQPHKKIFPKSLEFESSCETEKLPFVEVSVDRNAKDISISVSMKKYSKEDTEGSMDVIWEGDISEGELKEMQLGACASVPSLGFSSEHFVDKHYEKLVQRVSNVKEVLDVLKYLLTNEQCDTVTCEKTSQDQMRMLIKYVRGWGNNGKEKLLDALKKTNEQVIDGIEGQ